MAKELAVIEETPGQVQAAQQQTRVSYFDPLTPEAVNAFNEGQTIPLDEVENSWQPETVGETKRLLFIHAKVEDFYDEKTGEIKPSGKAVFVELLQVNGAPYLKKVKMGSVEVVAHLATIGKTDGQVTLCMPKPDMVNTMWDITYTGTRKSKTNALNKINTFSMKRVTIPA